MKIDFSKTEHGVKFTATMNSNDVWRECFDKLWNREQVINGDAIDDADNVIKARSSDAQKALSKHEKAAKKRLAEMSLVEDAIIIKPE